MALTFIYWLVDPITLQPMYVGKTNKPSIRLRHHVSPAVNARYKGCKGDWVRYLAWHGLRPVMELLCVCTTDESQLYEYRYYKLLCGAPLVNTGTIMRETFQYTLFD